jgi:hypothetical protein
LIVADAGPWKLAVAEAVELTLLRVKKLDKQGRAGFYAGRSEDDAGDQMCVANAYVLLLNERVLASLLQLWVGVPDLIRLP